MIKDDTGVSVLLEYIMSIVIMSVLFATLMVVLNSVIFSTDHTVTEPQMAIIANDIANQISGFSNEVNFNQYSDSSWNGGMSAYSSSLQLPDLAQDKQYAITITYDGAARTGYIAIWLTTNPNINRTTSFSSAVKVAPTTFYNNLDQGTMVYDVVGQEIEVTVP